MGFVNSPGQVKRMKSENTTRCHESSGKPSGIARTQQGKQKYKNTQLVKKLISSCLEENSKYAVSFGVDRNVSVIVNHEQEDRNRSDDMPTASSTQSART